MPLKLEWGVEVFNDLSYLLYFGISLEFFSDHKELSHSLRSTGFVHSYLSRQWVCLGFKAYLLPINSVFTGSMFILIKMFFFPPSLSQGLVKM